MLGIMGKEVPNDQTRPVKVRKSAKSSEGTEADIHLVVVPADSKREAAVDDVLHPVVGALE